MTRQRPPDYLREVERVFVALRGGAPFLTPADWEVARRWEERGIPLRLALSGIRAALGSHGAIAPRTPLRSCSAAVEREFAALRRQRAGAAPPPAAAPPDDRSGLEELAETLRRWTPDPGLVAPGRAAEARAAARAAADRVSSLGVPVAGPEGARGGCFESRLGEIDRDLLDRLRTALAPAARERISAHARRALAGHRARMPEPGWREAVAQAVRRRVRESLGVPPLTLAE